MFWTLSYVSVLVVALTCKWILQCCVRIHVCSVQMLLKHGCILLRSWNLNLCVQNVYLFFALLVFATLEVHWNCNRKPVFCIWKPLDVLCSFIPGFSVYENLLRNVASGSPVPGVVQYWEYSGTYPCSFGTPVEPSLWVPCITAHFFLALRYVKTSEATVTLFSSGWRNQISCE